MLQKNPAQLHRGQLFSIQFGNARAIFMLVDRVKPVLALYDERVWLVHCWSNKKDWNKTDYLSDSCWWWDYAQAP